MNMKRRFLSIFARINAILLICLFAINVPAFQAAAKSGQPYNLPVKVTNYSYDSKNNKWSKGETTKYRYNKKGDLIYTTDIGKITLKYKRGKVIKASNVSKEKYATFTLKTASSYTYDKKGRLSKRKTSTGTSSESAYVYTTKYYYNKKGTIYKKKDNNGALDIYELNNYSGKIPKEILFEGETFVYNKNGLPLSFDLGSVIYTYKYTYDEKGRVKSVIERLDGKKWRKCVFSYGKTKTRDIRLYAGIMGHITYGNPMVAIFEDVLHADLNHGGYL